MCRDTAAPTCPYTRTHPPPSLCRHVTPGCAGRRGLALVLHGARGVVAAGLAAGLRPQLFLKLLDDFLQVFPSLPFMHQVSSELLPVSLRVLKLNLQVLDLEKSMLKTQ